MKEEKSNWILIVFILTFILSVVFSFVSNVVSTKFPSGVLFILLLLTIGIGVLFDLIGTAAISANEATFHALNSKKKRGAKEGIYIVKNSNKISSICNDIIGDICGIISGSIGAMLAISLAFSMNISSTLSSILVAAFVSSLTVGGKAIFKHIAIKNADTIVFETAKVLSVFHIVK